LTTSVFLVALPCLLLSVENQTLTVRVHDVSGLQVRGATARLLSVDRVFEAKAKADGALQFAGIVPGTYDLEVSASGFGRRIFPDLRVAGSDQPLDVSFDHPLHLPDHCGHMNTVDYEARGLDGRTLSGYVIYEDTGKGISGVHIEVINAESGVTMGATVSGSHGVFAIHDLPAGRYNVRASKNAYDPAEITQFFVPRENMTILHLSLDKRGHNHICQ
jgi:hypothetical protein